MIYLRISRHKRHSRHRVLWHNGLARDGWVTDDGSAVIDNHGAHAAVGSILRHLGLRFLSPVGTIEQLKRLNRCMQVGGRWEPSQCTITQEDTRKLRPDNFAQKPNDFEKTGGMKP